MPTFGEIRHRLSKLPYGAGVDPTVLNGIINDRLKNILSSYPWSHLHQTAILETVAIYETGTVAFTEGSNAITLTDGTWTTAMTGREIRATGRNEFYIFTRVSNTTGTLDRVYEGEDVAESGYKIFQRLYELPSDIDFVESLSILQTDQDLDKANAEETDKLAASRLIYGRPIVYLNAPDTVDDDGNVVSRIELYPIPEIAEGLRLRYTKVIANLVSTADVLLSWIHPDVLIAGCESDLLNIKGDYTGSQFKLRQFEMGLQDMKRYDGNRENAAEAIMDERYTWHRTERELGIPRAGRYGRHFWQLRNSN